MVVRQHVLQLVRHGLDGGLEVELAGQRLRHVEQAPEHGLRAEPRPERAAFGGSEGLNRLRHRIEVHHVRRRRTRGKATPGRRDPAARLRVPAKDMRVPGFSAAAPCRTLAADAMPGHRAAAADWEVGILGRKP
ncbi:hypothetical protein GCM10011390_47320 [Aureimonas endophytica]|uniref:Uncharacterized protein n=1 Tax=Aureimonas endophytica TaxID=2027858 RepID=A0A917EDW3_9HYPH|nr:hypothetical protein GCM10011390_47320 [Aureimonas endophytica]